MYVLNSWLESAFLVCCCPHLLHMYVCIQVCTQIDRHVRLTHATHLHTYTHTHTHLKRLSQFQQGIRQRLHTYPPSAFTIRLSVCLTRFFLIVTHLNTHTHTHTLNVSPNSSKAFDKACTRALPLPLPLGCPSVLHDSFSSSIIQFTERRTLLWSRHIPYRQQRSSPSLVCAYVCMCMCVCVCMHECIHGTTHPTLEQTYTISPAEIEA
jgi:hypothetical protein